MAEANPFDQFDAQPTEKQKNPFDQFDFGSYPSVIGREAARGLTDIGGAVLKGAAALAPEWSPDFPDQKLPPIQERAPYKAGQAVEQYGEKTFPTTTAEDTSITGRVSRMAGGVGPLVVGTIVAPEAAVPVGAGVFATSSAGQMFDEAKRRGSTDEQAAKAAGLSAIAGGLVGVLPLGAVLAPVRQVAPGLVGWAATKFAQALQSGAAFSTVGEAQEFIDQEIKRKYASDYVGAPLDAFGSMGPNETEAAAPAGYKPDIARIGSSVIGGAAMGTFHPLGTEPPTPVSSPAQVDEFLGRANASARGAQTRAEIDEFLRQRAAREAAEPAPAGTPRLPPPTGEADNAFDQFDRGPQPSAPSAPSAPEDIVGSMFAEPNRVSPPAETPVEQPPAPSAPDQTTLKSLFANPLSADEIRADLAAKRGKADASGQNPTITPSVIPPAGPPSLQSLMTDERPAEQIRADIEAAKNWQPTSEWQEMPRALRGQPLDPQLEYRRQGGQVFARIPPTPGTRDNPVALYGPQDVHQGAQITAAPTPAQAEAGNYQKRHVEWNGLDIAIETEAGQPRKGIGANGQPWSNPSPAPYGYIKRTSGSDKEPVDVYLGPNPEAPNVYIVDQVDPHSGRFDEHKALIGFPDQTSAAAAYEKGFSDNSGKARAGALQSLTVEQFKNWLSKGDLRKPVAYSDPVAAAEGVANEIEVKPSDAALEAAAHTHKVSNTDLTHAVYTAIEQEALADHAAAMDTAKQEGLGDAWTSIPAATSEAGEGPAAAGEQPTEAQGAVPSEAPPARIEPHGAERPRGEAGGALGAIPVGRPKYTRTKSGGYSVDESELPKFTNIGDGFGARQYLDGWGNMRQEIRTPEGNVLIRGIQTDGKPYEEYEGSTSPFAPGGMAWVDRAIAKLQELRSRPRISQSILANHEVQEPPTEPEIAAGLLTHAALKKLHPKIAKMSSDERAATRRLLDEHFDIMQSEGRKIAEHCLGTGGKFSLRG